MRIATGRLLPALLAAAVLSAAPALAQAPPPVKGPYVPGVEGTSLAPDEVQELKSGMGMGLARAAELNGYPGPRHLLDLDDKLRLTAEQKEELKRITAETIDEAREMGRLVLAKEAELNGAFARREIDEARLKTLVGELADLWGRLRVIHLSAHLKTRKLLTPEQIAAYDKLRGYTDH